MSHCPYIPPRAAIPERAPVAADALPLFSVGGVTRTICAIARNGRPELRFYIPAQAHRPGAPVRTVED